MKMLPIKVIYVCHTVIDNHNQHFVTCKRKVLIRSADDLSRPTSIYQMTAVLLITDMDQCTMYRWLEHICNQQIRGQNSPKRTMSVSATGKLVPCPLRCHPPALTMMMTLPQWWPTTMHQWIRRKRLSIAVGPTALAWPMTLTLTYDLDLHL